MKASPLLRIAIPVLALSIFFLLDGIGEPNARALYHTDRFGEGQPEIDTISVTVQVFLPDQYGLLDPDVPYTTVIDITSRLSNPLSSPVTINSTSYFPLTEWPAGATYSVDGYGGHILQVRLPANITSFSVQFKGRMSGKSVLWRNVGQVNYPDIQIPLPYPQPHRSILVAPKDADIVKMYPPLYMESEPGSVESNVLESQYEEAVVIGEPASVVVVYEPTLWKPVATVLIFLAIAAVLILPYAPKFTEKYQAATIPRILLTLRDYVLRFASGLQARISKVSSRTLLTAYVLCSLLMVSLGLAVGPDPRPKAYAIAMSHTVDEIEEATGIKIISVLDTRTEFETLVSVGTVQAAIVADFLVREGLGKQLYGGLEEIPTIIIIDSIVVSPDFAQEVLRRYSEKTLVFRDVDAFRDALQRNPMLIQTRENQLGLVVDPKLFDGVMALAGLLSFILVFFGLAYLSNKLVEVGKKPGISAIPESIMYTSFYFFFTQLIYIVTSVAFAVPMGLHAVTSGSTKVTAIGALGFGGGSRPRMLAGMLGVLFGSTAALGEGSKLSKTGAIAFIIALFTVVADPLTGGLIFYEFVLLFTMGAVELEAASTTSYFIKNFLASVGLAFGAWITPTYGISTGEILFYMGAIPLCLIPKLGNSTATFLVFFSAFAIGNGGIRVAEMTPWKTFASCIPGIATGLMAAAVFFSLSKIEEIIRARMERAGTSV